MAVTRYKNIIEMTANGDSYNPTSMLNIKSIVFAGAAAGGDVAHITENASGSNKTVAYLTAGAAGDTVDIYACAQVDGITLTTLTSGRVVIYLE